MKSYLLPFVLVAGTGCAGSGNGTAQPAADTQQVVEAPEVPIACQTQPGSQAVEERRSPFDSARVEIAGRVAQICYGRPSARGRVVFGELVPYDKLWRTGANEPTVLHLPIAVEISGLRVEPGSYSLYTIPTAGEWTLIVNRSTSQWGHESRYTPEIEAHEIGRVQVPSERLDQAVETFTIRAEPTSAAIDLLLEWERTRVRVPVRAVS